MDQINAVNAVVALALGLIALGSGVGLKRVRPRLRARRELEREKDVALLGRPAVPYNPRTGETAQDRIPPLRELVAEIHHETRMNSGTSIKDAVLRIEEKVDTAIGEIRSRLAEGDERFNGLDGQLEEIRGQIAGELAKTTGALANAAEASKTGLQTIHDAILASPPADIA